MKSESAWTALLRLIFSWHTLRFLLEHFSILLEHSSTQHFSLKLFCQVNEQLLVRSCVASFEKARERVGLVCVCVCMCVCGWGVSHPTTNWPTFQPRPVYKKPDRRLTVGNNVLWFNILDKIQLLFYSLVYAEFRLSVDVPLFDKTIWKRDNK